MTRGKGKIREGEREGIERDRTRSPTQRQQPGTMGDTNMAFGLNRAEIIGRLGADVTVNHLANGGRVANLSIATDESYIDKNSGERVDRTEWHRAVTFQPGLVDMLEKHARKGRLVYVAGRMQTRRWRRDGEDSDRFSTEILLVPGSSSWTRRTAPTATARRKPRRRWTVRRYRPAAPRHRRTTWTKSRSEPLPLPLSLSRLGDRCFGAGPFRFAAGSEAAPAGAVRRRTAPPVTNPERRAGGAADGGRAGGEKYALRCAGSLCHACSVRQPASRVLHSATLRSGRDSQGNGAVRLNPPRRATVAPRSLRSLVRPHHSRTATGYALRPRWLPCASVSQQTVTAGRNDPHGSTQLRGATS